MNQILHMVDRINQKQAEIADDIASLRRALVSLHSTNLISPDSSGSHQQGHSLANGVGIQAVRTTNSANLNDNPQQAIIDATARYSSFLANGGAQ